MCVYPCVFPLASRSLLGFNSHIYLFHRDFYRELFNIQSNSVHIKILRPKLSIYSWNFYEIIPALCTREIAPPGNCAALKLFPRADACFSPRREMTTARKCISGKCVRVAFLFDLEQFVCAENIHFT